MPLTRPLLAGALVVCLLTVPLAVGQTAEYNVDIERSVDIPTRTIETKWGEQTISAVARYENGERLTVTTQAPAGESYAIRLIDSQQRLRESGYGTGNDEETFYLDRYEPGTYAIAMMNGTDEVLAIQPFVIAGYQVDQRTPNTATEGSEIQVVVNLTRVSNDVSDPPDNVQVVVGNDERTVRTDATRQSHRYYEATIDLESLLVGDYRVYTAVQRDNDVFGEAELIGLSETQQLSIQTEDTSTEQSQPIPPSETETETETETTHTTQTAGMPTTSVTDATTVTTRESEATQPSRETETEPSETTDRPTTERTDRTTETNGALLGDAGAIVALVTGLLLTRRFRDRE